ncbi:MAG: 3-methyl-2-oxobutanoate hydroxymethyltransferase [Candidatus Kapaibacterium sp.]|jgi:3-methyl-2-oxobutanoate hydroxymethyltransferase|nr:3-methyl-2-oxobutanoate hydroxymethyltransferase [Candidatus Kapabacteria bacterium]HRE58859.1 3-methyl-2-oxobutanoate hydroxymethyltransferase [Candidatus Kapabacteria bacterium]HRI30668.1 3-methyl-2-oxobutanoate hydroxymethyltransferase [Candidatus Kapabacteria bacterium]HRK58142.1 3-methyl-2-oxobutanoate hydroxymethyltransferase [Candidatus Kapabacteria bacterium]
MEQQSQDTEIHVHAAPIRRVTTRRLSDMKKKGQKIVCLTAYDALIARILDDAGVDVILVGDSLGNVVQGHDTTIPVTLEDIIYHTKAVIRGTRRSLVVADMPFMSYQVSAEEAFRNAGRLMKEAGAHAVKIEGGKRVADAVSRMTEAGIPVMGHLGLTPQSINQFGSYRVRGTSEEEQQQILDDAHALAQAGAFAIVLEKIPLSLAQKVSQAIDVPTIGIGAGNHCDGQILVYTDMLGMTIDFSPRFVRKYDNLHERMHNAVTQYCNDVRDIAFPSTEESY